jgi:hypothetical protein
VAPGTKAETAAGEIRVVITNDGDQGAYGLNGFSAELTVSRAPFSEAAIAERMAQDPQFYQRLAAFIAGEFDGQIGKRNSTLRGSNSDQMITAEVVRFRDAFQAVGTELQDVNQTTDPARRSARIAKAAKAAFEICTRFSHWCGEHPGLVRPMLELSAVGLAMHGLHQMGAPPGEALWVAYAIVRNEKLSDIFGQQKKN